MGKPNYLNINKHIKPVCDEYNNPNHVCLA